MKSQNHYPQNLSILGHLIQVTPENHLQHFESGLFRERQQRKTYDQSLKPLDAQLLLSVITHLITSHNNAKYRRAQKPPKDMRSQLIMLKGI